MLAAFVLVLAAAEPPPPAAAPAAPVAGSRVYTVDNRRSQLVLQVFKEGAAAALAHDHTVRATEVSGSITADPAAPESAKVSVTVLTKSLVNDEPLTRKQFGLDPEVPEKDRQAVLEAMRADNQLDVAKFASITFVSASVERSGEKLAIVGDFTLHGVTKRIKMPIAVKWGDDGCVTGDGKIHFVQSDYGIKPYSAFLGAVKNKDEVILNVHLVGVPQ